MITILVHEKGNRAITPKTTRFDVIRGQTVLGRVLGVVVKNAPDRQQAETEAVETYKTLLA